MKANKRLWIVVGCFFLVVPLGLITNEPAWGEWDREAYQELVGYIPAKLGEQPLPFKAPMPDYSIPGLPEWLSYYLSGIVGVLCLAAIFYIFKVTVAQHK